VTTPDATRADPPDWILRPSIVERLDWPAIFGNDHPVELELGAGDGSFLIDMAAARPDRNFIGVERLLGRLRKIDRKARRHGLENVRALRLEARYVLQWMVPPGGLAAIHVCFPDPWPKRRHWRRRLVSREFAAIAVNALAPAGLLCLRTDHEGYHQWMLEAVATEPRLKPAALPEPAASLKTDFEREFHARGIATHFATYERVG
jgi:tRNA (guanine-N7-)-methyltransferase